MDVSLSELGEMVMDGEAWRAAIHGVTKSQTWLSDWTELIFIFQWDKHDLSWMIYIYIFFFSSKNYQYKPIDDKAS